MQIKFKQLILLILGWLISHSGISQELQPYYTTDADEFCLSATLVEYNKILLLKAHSQFPNETGSFANYNDIFNNIQTMAIDTSYSLSTLIKTDENLNTLKIYTFQSTKDTLQVGLDAIENYISQEFVVLVGYITENVVSKYLLFTDYDFNVKRKVFIDTDIISDDGFGWGITIKKDLFSDNYIVSDIDKFYEVDAQTGVVNKVKTTSWGNTLQFPNKRLIKANSGSGFPIYNQDFEWDTIVLKNDPPQMYSKILKIVRPQNKDYIYSAGIFRHDTLTNIGLPVPLGFSDALVRVNQDLTLEYVFIDSVSLESTQGINGLHSLDLHNEDNIYFCINNNFCGYYFSSESCVEYLNFYNIDSEGEINYIKYIGGEANYIPLEIVALPDSSAIMFLARFEPGENELYESDTYFIKFDAQGNQIELDPEPYTSNAFIPLNNIPVYDVLVYPNPTSNILNFKTSLEKSDINVNIYNSKGKLVFQQEDIISPILLNSLAEGIYVYELVKNDRQLQTGNIVVKR